MPTVAVDGPFTFRINTRENAFEPPHVHVWEGNESLCRIQLDTGAYLDNPPPGRYRDILEAYARHADAIMRMWDQIHGDRR